MKARLNCYTYKRCGESFITIDRDEGVTPFMMNCRATPGCSGTSISSMYQDIEGEPSWEWRRPTPEEYEQMSPAMQEHIAMGGLEIYPIEPGKRDL